MHRLEVLESPVFDDQGDVTLVEGLAHDITQRKKAETELLRIQKLNDEAQRIGHLGHWELDLVNNQLTWSDECYRIFGVPIETGNTYESFMATVHPDDKGFVNRVYSESLMNQSAYNIEHRLLMADGSVKWVNERCETFYDDFGKPLRSVGTTMDISDYKSSGKRAW